MDNLGNYTKYRNEYKYPKNALYKDNANNPKVRVIELNEDAIEMSISNLKPNSLYVFAVKPKPNIGYPDRWFPYSLYSNTSSSSVLTQTYLERGNAVNILKVGSWECSSNKTLCVGELNRGKYLKKRQSSYKQPQEINQHEH